jgi:succinyl-diaminopimelate desuccinylase
MLDLSADGVQVTTALVDVPSVSGDEKALTDEVEIALRGCAPLDVERTGNVVVARTQLDLGRRVVLAGHLDTVPIADNVPSHRGDGRLYGCGTSDMKSGVAVALRIAHLIATGALRPTVDVTWICYDCEELEAARNGLGRLARERPEVLQADLGILLEPSDGRVEGGCQGTLRADVRTAGRRAHSARSWLGVNAVHALAPILARLREYQPRTVEVDGLAYREGLNAVGVAGGVAGNVIPDEASVTINYRFAPDRTEALAEAHVREMFPEYDVSIVDSAAGARPGLTDPLAASLVAADGSPPTAKLGWTDVARFGALGIPAVNLGPGDPNLAHTREESVEVARIAEVEAALVAFLSEASGTGRATVPR